MECIVKELVSLCQTCGKKLEQAHLSIYYKYYEKALEIFFFPFSSLLVLVLHFYVKYGFGMQNAESGLLKYEFHLERMQETCFHLVRQIA